MKGLTEQRDYAWAYFQLHASQRMSTFNFYIVISALITTGMTGLLASDNPRFFFGIVLGLTMVAVSFIFWKLDQRVSFLIRHAEEFLKKLEEKCAVESVLEEKTFNADLFFTEEEKTATNVNSWKFWQIKMSYSCCFASIYILFGLLGLVSIVINLSLMLKCS